MSKTKKVVLSSLYGSIGEKKSIPNEEVYLQQIKLLEAERDALLAELKNCSLCTSMVYRYSISGLVERVETVCPKKLRRPV